VVILVLKHRALRHKCRAVSSNAFAAASLIGSEGSIDVFKDDGVYLTPTLRIWSAKFCSVVVPV